MYNQVACVWLCSEVFHFHTGTCHSEPICRIVIPGIQEEPSSPVSTRYLYLYSRCKLLHHVFTETRSVLFPALSHLYWFRTRGVDTSKWSVWSVVYSGGWKPPRVPNKGGLAQIEVFII